MTSHVYLEQRGRYETAVLIALLDCLEEERPPWKGRSMITGQITSYGLSPRLRGPSVGNRV